MLVNIQYSLINQHQQLKFELLIEISDGSFRLILILIVYHS